MAQTIQIKNGTGSSAPATLLQGELAINVSSGSLWYGSGSSNATHSNWMFGEITASNKIRNHLGNHTGTGNITASGTVNAGFFVGDGSGITNLSIDGQGALLESELANVAAVKAINQQLTTTSAVQFASLNVTSITSSIVTSSVVYSSGSNIFGDEPSDNHTFNGSITASGNIQANSIKIGDSTGAIPAYDFHIKDSTSVNAVLECTTNGNATLELKNNQTPDWYIRNKHSTGGLDFGAAHRVFHLDDNGTATISGSLVLSGTGVTSNISASGNISSSGLTVAGNISSSGTVQMGRILFTNGDRTLYNLNSMLHIGDGIGAVTLPDTKVNGDITGSRHISASGNIFASDAEFTGTIEAAVKSFSIPHQSIKGKKLVYGVLEGPEHSVYVRGKTQDKIIELPEEWRWLVREDSITVQLTAIGKSQNLFVKDISDNKIFINNDALFSSKVNAYYVVHATRKDVNKLKTVK